MFKLFQDSKLSSFITEASSPLKLKAFGKWQVNGCIKRFLLPKRHHSRTKCHFGFCQKCVPHQCTYVLLFPYLFLFFANMLIFILLQILTNYTILLSALLQTAIVENVLADSKSLLILLIGCMTVNKSIMWILFTGGKDGWILRHWNFWKRWVS